MDNITIGTIISRLRYEKGYSKRQLCQGICSVSQYDRIENDVAEVDKYLLDMLLQRLGKSSDKLEVILSDKEYDCLYKRDYIEELIWKQDRRGALSALKEYENQHAKDNRGQKMFVLRNRSRISYKLDHDIEKAEQYIRQAIEVTIPEFSDENMRDCLISGIELENILQLGRYLIEQEKEAEGLLLGCRQYIDHNVTDMEEYSKLNSKLSWLQARLLIKNRKYFEAMQICIDAVTYLRKYGILYFMIPLLEQIIFCGEKMNKSHNLNKWKNYYDILMALYRDYGENWYCHDDLFHNCHQTVYHLAGEFIHQERCSRNLTQEQLIEGIYIFPENLSRVERGENAPSRRKFDELMNKLGIERGKYCGTAIVEDYELLELKYEIDILIGTCEYEETQNKLEQLRNGVDYSKWLNRMAVEAYQSMIDVRCGRADAKETYEKLMDLLEESCILQDNVIHRVPFYNEMLVLNMMCECLRRMNTTQLCVPIFQEVIKRGEESRVDIKYQNNVISLILANISLIDSQGIWCDRGIAYELLCGKGNMIYMHLMSKIGVEKNEKTRRETTRLAFYMADLFYRETNQQRIRTYYEQTYKEPLP